MLLGHYCNLHILVGFSIDVLFSKIPGILIRIVRYSHSGIPKHTTTFNRSKKLLQSVSRESFHWSCKRKIYMNVAEAHVHIVFVCYSVLTYTWWETDHLLWIVGTWVRFSCVLEIATYFRLYQNWIGLIRRKCYKYFVTCIPQFIFNEWIIALGHW